MIYVFLGLFVVLTVLGWYRSKKLQHTLVTVRAELEKATLELRVSRQTLEDTQVRSPRAPEFAAQSDTTPDHEKDTEAGVTKSAPVGVEMGTKQLHKESANDDPFFQKFSDVVATQYSDERFNRAKAADLLAISERQLNRKLNALMDYNFAEYLRRYRLRQAALKLDEGQAVADVAFDVGFASASYFSTCFKAEFGMSPSQYQASGAGR